MTSQDEGPEGPYLHPRLGDLGGARNVTPSSLCDSHGRETALTELRSAAGEGDRGADFYDKSSAFHGVT